MSTHRVANQVAPLCNYNLFERDQPLVEAVQREGAAWAQSPLIAFGVDAGQAEAIEWGVDANRYPPELRTHDRAGQRLDQISYHPAYHALMARSVRQGLHAMPWREPRAGAHVARAAFFMLASQNDCGHGCPISMTHAAVPTLRLQPALAAAWEPRITSLDYDPRSLPAEHKRGALVGMAMTEKQGGSDVRANATRAVAIDQPGAGAAYRLTGHKWFCSAPASDAFLVLAQASGGLSCFFVPRFRPDATPNPFFIQRLKDKLGNRSNASAEVEFDDTYGVLVGEEGRGVPSIIHMVNHTRFDSALGSAALMRQALVQAIHYARERKAFGKLLIDQPLMQNVLADLALESEAATVLLLRLARAYDTSDERSPEAAFKRIAIALAKYWVCKRAPLFVAEALECIGGNGYVETYPLARLYREAPLNSIWEGSGNVICLDVLRALSREPETLHALFQEIDAAAPDNMLVRAAAITLREVLAALTRPGADRAETQASARRIVEQLVLTLQAALLVRVAPSSIAETFCTTRLARNWGYAFGTLPPDTNFTAIIDRAFACG